jgi:ribose 1,5-bisphosphokinase
MALYRLSVVSGEEAFVSADEAGRPSPFPMRSELGCLVFVVGPSGAGKDTLIRLAARELDGEPAVRVARRVITRASNDHEDHGSVDQALFEAMSAAGVFCLEWAAHGLRYGILREVEDEVRLGAIVICNGSRAAASRMRRRFVKSAIVLITAPRQILAERLAARGRDVSISDRLGRDLENWAHDDADHVIDNSGNPADAAAELVSFVRGLLPAGA